MGEDVKGEGGRMSRRKGGEYLESKKLLAVTQHASYVLNGELYCWSQKVKGQIQPDQLCGIAPL